MPAHTLTVVIGTLHGITDLTVGSSKYAGGTVNLNAGQSVSW
jgi:hypothetical protein